jgi:hypothetical protein
MTSESSRPRWNPWPVSIIAFFILLVIACVSMVVFCSRHPADLVTADYYEQELRYQSQMDRVQHARQRGELATVAYDSAAKKITITLPPASSPEPLTGNVELYRPSAVDMDRQFKLEPTSAGTQTIDASTLAPGLWKVRVSWTAANQDYFLDQKIIIKAAS